MSAIENASQVGQFLAEERGPAPLQKPAGRYRLLNHQVESEIELDTTPIGYRDFEKRIESRHKRGFTYILAIITNKVEKVVKGVSTTKEIKHYFDAAELHKWRNQAQEEENDFINPLSAKQIEKIEYFFSDSSDSTLFKFLFTIDFTNQAPNEEKKKLALLEAELIASKKRLPYAPKASMVPSERADQTSLSLCFAAKKMETGSPLSKLFAEVINPLRYWNAAAERQDVMACYHLGCLHANEQSPDFSPEKALFYFQVSANQGFAPALAKLGWCYQAGFGVETDDRQSQNFFKLAGALINLELCKALVALPEAEWKPFFQQQKKLAEGNSSASQVFVGYCYLFGIGTPIDKEQGNNYFLLAAQHQNSLGLFHGGRFLEQYHENPLLAAQAYEAIADNPFAKLHLARFFQEGSKPNQRGEYIIKDPVRAFELIREVAQLGYAPAIEELGYAYLYGLGAEPCIEEALRLFHLAAKQNCAQALNDLALCYERGTGVDASPAQALIYFEKAAALGLSAAEHNLARLIEDPKKSIYYLKRSVSRGRTDFLYQLALRYLQGNKAKRNISKGMRFLQQAAEQGDVEAKTVYGIALVRGDKVVKNVELGMDYIDEVIQAAWMGDKRAKGILMEKFKPIPGMEELVAQLSNM